ncbi:MAG: ABC transporter ATP-binding protein [Oscillospiraceae bacterium]|jgi:iron complex transport system ATP-binding protein|nr:ABC transporter ATP-binding protein [Oscillospiraceae bacterium]
MIKTKNLNVKYEKHEVIPDFSFEVVQGEILSILGPNGSGKSTILNAIAKFIAHQDGVIYLEGSDMAKMGVKAVAKRLSVLAQVNQSPEDFTVRDLIYYGRLPHKKWYEQKNEKDDCVIEWAIGQTNLSALADKRVVTLSGGERQRVWIALALAQEPKVLMLDEPTTYLDICHQIEVLELLKDLNKRLGLTIVMVLHDLAHAARYSDRVVVLQNGSMVADGRPEEVLTKELIREVYHVDAYIATDECLGGFCILPVKICKTQKEAAHA